MRFGNWRDPNDDFPHRLLNTDAFAFETAALALISATRTLLPPPKWGAGVFALFSTRMAYNSQQFLHIRVLPGRHGLLFWQPKGSGPINFISLFSFECRQKLIHD
jgi:hypothetical protein